MPFLFSVWLSARYWEIYLRANAEIIKYCDESESLVLFISHAFSEAFFFPGILGISKNF